MDNIKNCDYCGYEAKIGEFHYIYCFVVETDKQEEHYIGLEKVLNELSEYLMDKKCHLSASQIILFRPDIVKEYLATTFLDCKVIDFHFQRYVICMECYEDYVKLMPLI